MESTNIAQMQKRGTMRILLNKMAKFIFFLATIFSLIVLAILIYSVLADGVGTLNIEYLTGKLSTQLEKARIMVAILGTLWLMAIVISVTIFIGVRTALYLVLYAKKGRVLLLIQTNISNLAGVLS